jgi:hypothetical protein
MEILSELMSISPSRVQNNNIFFFCLRVIRPKAVPRVRSNTPHLRYTYIDDLGMMMVGDGVYRGLNSVQNNNTRCALKN